MACLGSFLVIPKHYSHITEVYLNLFKDTLKGVRSKDKKKLLADENSQSQWARQLSRLYTRYNCTFIFQSHLYIHIMPPSTYFSFFFTKEGRKIEKNAFSPLNFYIFSPNHSGSKNVAILALIKNSSINSPVMLFFNIYLVFYTKCFLSYVK